MHAVPIRSPGRGQELTVDQADVVADAARLAAEICETSLSAVALGDGDEIAFPAAVGFRPIPGPLAGGIWQRVLESPDGRLVISDAAADAGLAADPIVSGDPGVRFIAALALEGHDGMRHGILAVMGPEVRHLGVEQAEALEALARLLAAHLDLRKLVGRLQHAVTERDLYERQLEEYQIRLERNLAEISERSLTDPLTGLRNRRAFRDDLEEAVRRTGGGGRPVALVLLDVDAFKPFNDAYGHPAGDDVLAGVASVFADRVRSTDVVARIGGDEFAVILPNTDQEGGFVLAERLRRAVERSGVSAAQITVSAGVAAIPPAGADAEELLAAADRALYAAKARGRNCVEVAPA